MFRRTRLDVHSRQIVEQTVFCGNGQTRFTIDKPAKVGNMRRPIFANMGAAAAAGVFVGVATANAAPPP
jgi:hypothetical protein